MLTSFSTRKFITSLRYAFAKEQIDDRASPKELAELLGIKEVRAKELVVLLK